MSVLQSTFDENPAIGYAGMVANGELSNRISRTCADAAGIGFGKAVYSGSTAHTCTAVQALTAVGAAVAGNTGNGTISAAPVITAGAKAGVYTVTLLEPATNAGEFMVQDPDGINIGNGTVAVAYSADGLAFTVADGATDFAAGDQFTITVSGSNVLGITIATVGQGLLAGDTADTYEQYDNVPIITQGAIFVKAGGTVAVGQDVYVDALGDFVAPSSTAVPAAGWVYDMAGVDDDIVRIVRR
jgi:hypothetical protein